MPQLGVIAAARPDSLGATKTRILVTADLDDVQQVYTNAVIDEGGQ